MNKEDKKWNRLTHRRLKRMKIIKSKGKNEEDSEDEQL